MTTFSNAYWTATLPAGWVSESDEECDSFYHPDGFGTLQISVVEHDQDVTTDFLQELAAEHLEAGAKPSDITCGKFKGFELGYEDGDELWQEWYLRSGKLILFATYNCAIDDEGLEDEAVTGILRSLKNTTRQ